jgi:hypothetical protein
MALNEYLESSESPPRTLGELFKRWDADLQLAEQSTITSILPSDSMPKDTYWQRFRAKVADYLSKPYS